jgi:hypothetical protein
VLVRVATARYVLPGGFAPPDERCTSVADALRTLLLSDVAPNVDIRAKHNVAAVRERMYSQDVDEVLRTWEAPLRSLFDTYALGDGAVGDKLNDTSLLGYSEWRRLVAHLGLNWRDLDLKEPDTTLPYSWSRMRVVDVRPLKSRVKLTQLAFEDFLEALAHVAEMMTLPTVEQVRFQP